MTGLLALLLLAAPPEGQRVEWTVDGVAREALVYVPAKKAEDGKPPLVVALSSIPAATRTPTRRRL